MKRLASVTFTTTDIDPPAGVTVAGFDANLFLDGAPIGETMHVSDSTTKITLTITAAGAYHVEFARVSDTGEAVASPAASNVVVVKPDMIAVPLTVTLTIGDVPVSTLPPVPSSPPSPSTSMAASTPPAKSPESASPAIPAVQ